MQRTSLEATSQTRCTGGFSLHTLWQKSNSSPGYVLFGAVVGGGVSPTVSWIKVERPPPRESTATQSLTRTYRPYKGKTGISNGP